MDLGALPPPPRPWGEGRGGRKRGGMGRGGEMGGPNQVDNHLQIKLTGDVIVQPMEGAKR